MKDVRPPFTFNVFKHHIEWFREFLKEPGVEVVDEFQKGNNLMSDYYLGELSVCEIQDEIESKLRKQNTWERNQYRDYITKAEKDYQNVVLSDGSIWTLLIGDANYIHIHPARYSPHTIRARMLTLKTAMLYRKYIGEVLSLADINKVRSQHLHVSPVKHIGAHLQFVFSLIQKML